MPIEELLEWILCTMQLNLLHERSSLTQGMSNCISTWRLVSFPLLEYAIWPPRWDIHVRLKIVFGLQNLFRVTSNLVGILISTNECQDLAEWLTVYSTRYLQNHLWNQTRSYSWVAPVGSIEKMIKFRSTWTSEADKKYSTDIGFGK